ncbi:hypothetical protein BD560DRAFT_226848 [Blakeslea trispora]|nr:hypothetical protein BD560DRAFT_226848 [Blakeslea trispora]
MARVHMFKPSLEKQNRDAVLDQQDLPASPSLQNTTTEQPQHLDPALDSAIDNVLPPLLGSEPKKDNTSAATLLQKTSSEMDVIGTVTAALSVKSGA